MVQYARALASFSVIARDTARLYPPLRTLRDTLDQAQNAPPLGQGDGSITEEHWTKLDRVARALEDLLRSIAEVPRV